MLKLLTYKIFLSVAKLGQTQKTNVSSAFEEAILLFQIIVQYMFESSNRLLSLTTTLR